jgi:hypothetical protein
MSQLLTWHPLRSALRGSSPQKFALSHVLRKRRSALELGARLLVSAELLEEVAADGRQQVIRLQRRLVDKCVHKAEAGIRSERHPYGDRQIQLDHR